MMRSIMNLNCVIQATSLEVLATARLVALHNAEAKRSRDLLVGNHPVQLPKLATRMGPHTGLTCAQAEVPHVALQASRASLGQDAPNEASQAHGGGCGLEKTAWVWERNSESQSEVATPSRR